MRCTNQPNRKASLSISTNAIVVLIIAVIMLGLIIGLVTQAFGAVEERFLSQIQDTEPEPDPTSTSRPIQLSKDSVRASAGDLVGLKVRIRNTYNDNYTMYPYLNCSSDIIATGSHQSNERTIPSNSEDIFTYIFSIDDAASSNPFLCELQAVNNTGSGEQYHDEIGTFEHKILEDIRPSDFTVHVN